jgi:hypothetical protein
MMKELACPGRWSGFDVIVPASIGTILKAGRMSRNRFMAEQMIGL